LWGVGHGEKKKTGRISQKMKVREKKLMGQFERRDLSKCKFFAEFQRGEQKGAVGSKLKNFRGKREERGHLWGNWKRTNKVGRRNRNRALGGLKKSVREGEGTVRGFFRKGEYLRKREPSGGE